MLISHGAVAPENQAMNAGCPSSDAPRCAGLGRSGQTVSKEAWSDQAPTRSGPAWRHGISNHGISCTQHANKC